MTSRANMMERGRGERTYDLIIIGGGITGCGVAWAAASRGARVLLLERGDFAQGTSSRSTKLVHGGIRYLKQLDFRLVREGVQERQRLIQAAPHLVRPVQFVYPVYRADSDPLWLLRLGLLLYDRFAGRRNLMPHRIYPGRSLLNEEPLLREEGLMGGALYADCITDDARLTLEVAKAAARRGAVLLNYTEALGFIKDEMGRIRGVEAMDGLTGAALNFRSDAVLNAAGPWADAVRRLDDPASRPVLRPTKGVHVTVPWERLPLRRPVVMHAADQRLMFAVPRDGFTYLGTTDTDYPGDPDEAGVEMSEVAYILDAANRLFPDAGLATADVCSAWAGIRTLAALSEHAAPSQISRDYRLYYSRSGLVSVAGGKLTAFAAMAQAIVRRMLPGLRGDRVSLALGGTALPAPGQAQALALEYGLSEQEVRELWTRHGCETPAVLAYVDAGSSPSPTESCFGRTGASLGGAGVTPARIRMLCAEAAFAVAHEFAVTLADVLDRRTAQLLFSPDSGLGAAEAVAGEMGRHLHWHAAETDAQVDAYANVVRRMMAWRSTVR